MYVLDLPYEHVSRCTHHVALMDLWVHGELNDEPGGVPKDERCDEIPVDDVPQTTDTPERERERGGELLHYI